MDQFLDFSSTYQEVSFQQNKYLLIYIKIISFMNVKNLFKNFFGAEYCKIVWNHKNIDTVVKTSQADVLNKKFPSCISNAQTGINAIDSAIRDLYEFGHTHNLPRMYIASITTNIAKTHW